MAGIFDAFTNDNFLNALGRSQSAGGQSAPVAPAPAPASRNPFAGLASSRLGASDGPLARAGWIGALMTGNNPTMAQMQEQRLVGPQSQAAQAISQDIASGTDPGRAIINYIQTPEGQNYFTSGGDLKSLANLADLATAPKPKPVVMSPGQIAGTTDPNSGVFTPNYTAPTTDLQTFNALADIGKLTDDQRAVLAQSALAAKQGNSTQQERAIGELVRKGVMSQDTADLLLGGVLETTPIYDAGGKHTGDVVINKATNQVFQPAPAPATGQGDLPNPGSRDYAEGVTPGAPGSTTAAPQSVPADANAMYTGMDDPADIVTSTGPIAYIQNALSALGILNPKLAPAETNRSRRILDMISVGAQMLGRSSDGKLLKQQAEQIANISDTLKFNTSPIDTTNTLLQLHDMYDNRLNTDEQIMNDPKSTAEVRGNAAVDIAAVKRAQATLPPRENLTAKLKVLQSEQSGERIAKSVHEGVKNAEDTISGTEKTIAKERGQAEPTGQTHTYQDTEEGRAQALRDKQSGVWHKGDIINFGGKRWPIKVDPSTVK